MNTQIIDGKKISREILDKLKHEIKALPYEIGLSVIIVGEDAGSMVYVGNKIKTCEELEIASTAYYLPASVSENELLELIETLNNDKKTNGILVQLPLPKHIDEQKILEVINPIKDVDGFHRVNAGALFTGGDGIRPCTPSGIIELIKSTNISIEGKNTVVVGRSNIVGKPVAMLMLEQNSTVTIVHSRTKDLKAYTKNADILIVATGKPKLIKKEHIKEGAVVIDVGVNRLEKLCGDVDFDDVLGTAGFITPVPGGVGPMTIAMLMTNTVKAAKLQHKN